MEQKEEQVLRAAQDRQWQISRSEREAEEEERWVAMAVARSERRKKLVRSIENKVEVAMQLWWQEALQDFKVGWHLLHTDTCTPSNTPSNT